MRRPSTIRRYGSKAYRSGQSAIRNRVLGPLTSRGRLGAVAMFHIGRCGSTVLSDLLDQHPKIRWDGESYVRVGKRMKREGIEPRSSGFDPAAYIDSRLNRVGARWFLYTLKFDQVEQYSWEMSRYLDEIERYGVTRLIVLDRSNLLRKVVSDEMARARGRYQSRDPGEVERLMIRIDVDAVETDGGFGSLISQFDRWTGQYELFDRLVEDRSVLRLNYESDILADPRVAHHMVLDHLHLDPHPVDVRLQRLNPFALSEVIENFAEVEKALDGTPHAWMLDD